MSRCLHFLPLDFEKDKTIRNAALIESIKLRGEWENARAERKNEKKTVENVKKQSTTNGEKHEKKSVEKVKKQNTANDEKKFRTTAAEGKAKRLSHAKSNEQYRYLSGTLLTEDERSGLTEESDSPFSRHHCSLLDRLKNSKKRKRESLDSGDDGVHGGKKIKTRISQPSQRTKKLQTTDRPFNAQCKNEKLPDQRKAEMGGVCKRKSLVSSNSRRNVSRAAIARPAAEVGVRKPTNVTRIGTELKSKRRNGASDSVSNVAREAVSRFDFKVPTKKRSLLNCRLNVSFLKQWGLQDPTTNVAGGSVAGTGAELQSKRRKGASESVSNVAKKTVARSDSIVPTRKRSVLNYGPNVSRDIARLAADPGFGKKHDPTTNVAGGSVARTGTSLKSKRNDGASKSVSNDARESIVRSGFEVPTKKRSVLNYRPNVSWDISRLAADLGFEKELGFHDPTTNVAGESVARIGTKLKRKRQNGASDSVSHVANETVARNAKRSKVSAESLSRKERRNEKRRQEMQREEMEYNALFLNWKPPPLQLQREDPEDLGWLFDNKTKEPCGSKGSQPINTAPAPTPCLTLWPKAHYIPKEDVYALPYTVPL